MSGKPGLSGLTGAGSVKLRCQYRKGHLPPFEIV
jgi:hypothetical protein